MIAKKLQENYAAKKAHLEALEAQEKELERQYIINNGIVNPDGSIPEFIYCIEDDKTFDRANTENATHLEEAGLWAKILDAREMLARAEEALLKYALSLVPSPEREILAKRVNDDFTTRETVLALVLKLDASTVPA